MKRFVFLLFVAILAYRLEAHKSVDSVIHAYQTVMSCMNKNKRALLEETVKTIMNCYTFYRDRSLKIGNESSETL